MTEVNKLTKRNNYVQSGGFLMIVAKIGEFLLGSRIKKGSNLNNV